MDFFEKELVEKALAQKFAFILVTVEDYVMTLTLNRPEKKNALHPHMIHEIAFALQYANQTKEIWVVMIRATGDVFCSGADLKAFMGMVGDFDSSIPEAKGEVLLGELFAKTHKPIITSVEGRVMAGGFFFLTGAHYVVCHPEVTLGLPEVKRGLFPFQVMASLLEVMPKRIVIDWCIRGYNLGVQDAKNYGLITHVADKESAVQIANNIISDIKENSPTAIRHGLEALDTITQHESKHQYLMEMLQKTIGSKDGQEGLLAFRQKRKPEWTGE